jgi:hypothetical protein
LEKEGCAALPLRDKAGVEGALGLWAAASAAFGRGPPEGPVAARLLPRMRVETLLMGVDGALGVRPGASHGQ